MEPCGSGEGRREQRPCPRPGPGTLNSTQGTRGAHRRAFGARSAVRPHRALKGTREAGHARSHARGSSRASSGGGGAVSYPPAPAPARQRGRSRGFPSRAARAAHGEPWRSGAVSSTEGQQEGCAPSPPPGHLPGCPQSPLAPAAPSRLSAPAGLRGRVRPWGRLLPAGAEERSVGFKETPERLLGVLGLTPQHPGGGEHSCSGGLRLASEWLLPAPSGRVRGAQGSLEAACSHPRGGQGAPMRGEPLRFPADKRQRVQRSESVNIRDAFALTVPLG